MSSLSGKTILIIDDAEDIRMLARRILETDGATVYEAESVAVGIQRSEEVNPHLIVVDLNFEGADGFFFLEQRRSSAALAAVPSIVLSGLNDRESIVKAVALGASDYLLKPFRATLLLQKARKHLRVASFAAHVFPPGAMEAATINVPATVSFLTESSVQVEAPVKLAQDQILEIESQFLDDAGVVNVLLKTGSRAPGYVGPGRYTNQILFTGVGEDFARKMRKAVKGDK